MKEAFPSNGEREVASVLLLLSAISSSLLLLSAISSSLLLLSAISSSPLPKSECITVNSHKVALSNSNSKSKSEASSILTSVDCSFMENRSQSRRVKMIATSCDQTMKLKIYIGDFRRLLDKSFFISDCQKMSSGKPASATTSRTTFCRSTAVSASSSSYNKQSSEQG